MRTLTQKERRTVRWGGAILSGYLVVYFALQLWAGLSSRHAQYEQLLGEAKTLRAKIKLYQSRVELTQKLMATYRMNPAKLAHESVLAQASAAIQNAAMGGGVQIGPIRETAARPSSKELGSIQLEAAGPAPALLKFVQQTCSLGFPLLIEQMQLGSEPSRPGQVKLNLTFVVLDFDQWKPEKNHA